MSEDLPYVVIEGVALDRAQVATLKMALLTWHAATAETARAHPGIEPSVRAASEILTLMMVEH